MFQSHGCGEFLPYLTTKFSRIEFEWAIPEKVAEAGIGKSFGDGPTEFVIQKIAPVY